MERYETEQVERLAAENPELQRLLDEHRTLDARVDALNRRRVRTPQEEMERKQLSKQKLAGKDRMARLIAKMNQDG
jgi:uncharacterized protein YdcH (DUF465 family)